MPLKSVIDIVVNQAAWMNFQRAYGRYQQSLKSMPAAWAQVQSKIDGTRASYNKLVATLAAQNVQTRLIAKAQEEADRRTRTVADRWKSIAQTTGLVAANIRSATVSVFKWGALGLLGTGGLLFGLDRLAMAAANTRRASLGLGTTYGEQKAFTTNFGRLVDPDQFLSAVAGSRFDITKRVGLIGAGLSQQELAGDTASTAVALLKHLKQIADTTDPRLFAQVIASRQLGQFASPQDLERLRNTRPDEFNALIRGYNANRQGLDVAPDIAKKWQDFVTQLERAGQTIEKILITGLSGLAVPLTHLSEGFVKVAEAFFIKGGPLEQGIIAVGDSFDRFAKYIGTPEFKETVSGFARDIVVLAQAVAAAVKWTASWFKKEPAPFGFDSMGGPKPDPGTLTDEFGIPTGGRNNPGNLRSTAGSQYGFRGFDSEEAGLRAMAAQVLRDQKVHGQNTIREIIGGTASWPGYSKTDVPEYIRNVSRWTGIGADEKLNLNDPDQLARVVAAMIRQEQSAGHYDKYKDARVVVDVLNSTGGNAVVSVNGMRQ